jgi:hypothetical protein
MGRRRHGRRRNDFARVDADMEALKTSFVSLRNVTSQFDGTTPGGHF